MQKNRCKVCEKRTTILCAGCRQPICADHGRAMQGTAWCDECFEKKRRKARVAQVVLLGIIIGSGLVLLALT